MGKYCSIYMFLVATEEGTFEERFETFAFLLCSEMALTNATAGRIEILRYIATHRTLIGRFDFLIRTRMSFGLYNIIISIMD